MAPINAKLAPLQLNAHLGGLRPPTTLHTKKKRSKMTHYIVMTASAKVSGKARQFGRYGHVAVVEVENADTVPVMISERARGVVRIVWDSGACSIGKTDRSAFAVAKAHATAMAARLNAA